MYDDEVREEGGAREGQTPRLRAMAEHGGGGGWVFAGSRERELARALECCVHAAGRSPGRGAGTSTSVRLALERPAGAGLARRKATTSKKTLEINATKARSMPARAAVRAAVRIGIRMSVYRKQVPSDVALRADR